MLKLIDGTSRGLPDPARIPKGRDDEFHDAALTSLIPAMSCRSCRPNAPFAELVRLSRTSIADEMREEHRRFGTSAA
jgi:hypothetical protein